MLNLHRLLFRQADSQNFHAVVQPTDAQRQVLTAAKNAIRDHLRVTLAGASTTVFGMARKVEPRFRTQGSWSYRTCLQPAHQPPQEMDWDFGVYLPATVWQGTQPGFAAKAYFEIVDKALTALCRQKGWKLLNGPGCKATCIRVQIESWCHIDVCLYAAPEQQFTLISELAKSFGASRSGSQTRDMAYFAEDAAAGEPDWPWDKLEQIMLATRTGEWKPSDPHAVSRWFSDAVEEHTEQLRRACCYLKGWRDHVWPDGGGPSSILLMICATTGFEARRGRDDVMLQEVAERVSKMLLSDVYVKAIDKGVENFNRLDEKERARASRLAADFRWAIQMARGYSESMKFDAVVKMQGVLGPRVPLRPDFVEVEGASEVVRATPAIAVSAPVVKTTKAG